MTDDHATPYRLLTHERCSDPCPRLRARVKDHPDFELGGMWGPHVETADGETIAEGHQEVETFLDEYLGD